MKGLNNTSHLLIILIMEILKPGKNITEGYYSHGDSSEILMYVNEYTFLLISMPLLESYVKINTKKKKTN